MFILLCFNWFVTYLYRNYYALNFDRTNQTSQQGYSFLR